MEKNRNNLKFASITNINRKTIIIHPNIYKQRKGINMHDNLKSYKSINWAHSAILGYDIKLFVRFIWNEKIIFPNIRLIIKGLEQELRSYYISRNKRINFIQLCNSIS